MLTEDELYYNHNGRGPDVARIIVRHANGRVLMECKKPGGKWHSFSLSADFLDNSPARGWKKRAPDKKGK